eukprot:TRINITY_DN12054_c0_g1_i1.p1 TRINITY_DN12054_c0_g1~~TRINITY_DN12054_c0_g1_i1.p1  ORF type:complete len:520 (-),score=120.21 TRINITY_DN12054_c0_g1_i1:241-1800(-)
MSSSSSSSSSSSNNYDESIELDYAYFDNSESEKIVLKEQIPELIANFIVYFYKQLQENGVFEINTIYETTFNKLTDRFYKNSPWPDVETILPLANDDNLFKLLYKELYYRQIYAKVKPITLQHRIDSWNNYCELFDLFLDEPLENSLPVNWLWGMVDEYIYQFQSFCRYRWANQNRSQNDLNILSESSHVWNIETVMRYLYRFIEKSDIVQKLEQGNVYFNHSENSHDLYKMLGYFSIIGLLRINCLLADYHQALKIIQPIDLSNKKNGLFTAVIACYISLYYHTGFAYMVMRRYSDAIRTFSQILLHISRTEQLIDRSYQYDQVSKHRDQMYNLLLICLSLHPQRIDDSLRSKLKEKTGDKYAKLQKGNIGTFGDVFSFACPRFINPAIPDYNNLEKYANQTKPLQLQLSLFKDEIKQQSLLPVIKSYLKLYSSIPISKLSTFLEVDEEELRTALLSVKYKTSTTMKTNKTYSSEIDFYIDGDMIYISDTKIARRYGDYFIRLINKFDNMIVDIDNRK